MIVSEQAVMTFASRLSGPHDFGCKQVSTSPNCYRCERYFVQTSLHSRLESPGLDFRAYLHGGKRTIYN